MTSNLFCINNYAVSNSDPSLPLPLHTKMAAYASFVQVLS